MQSNLIYKKNTILIKILSKLLDNNNSLPGSGAKKLDACSIVVVVI